MCADSVCELMEPKDGSRQYIHEETLYDDPIENRQTLAKISSVSHRHNGYWIWVVKDWAMKKGLAVKQFHQTGRYDSAVVVEATPAEILEFLDFAWGEEGSGRTFEWQKADAHAIRELIRHTLDPKQKYDIYADIWS